MGAINTAFTETDHYSTKRQILGIIAGDFPLSMLHARFPGINSYQLKAARKHAMSKGNLNYKKYNNKKSSFDQFSKIFQQEILLF